MTDVSKSTTEVPDVNHQETKTIVATKERPETVTSVGGDASVSANPVLPGAVPSTPGPKVSRIEPR